MRTRLAWPFRLTCSPMPRIVRPVGLPVGLPDGVLLMPKETKWYASTCCRAWLPTSTATPVGEALAEVSRRKASPVAEDAATRFDRSPYGGYRVFTVSMSFAMDLLEDPVVSRRFVSTQPPGPSLYDHDSI